jgi:hypothetical protein
MYHHLHEQTPDGGFARLARCDYREVKVINCLCCRYPVQCDRKETDCSPDGTSYGSSHIENSSGNSSDLRFHCNIKRTRVLGNAVSHVQEDVSALHQRKLSMRD